MKPESRRYEEYLDDVLRDPAEAAGYLNACLEDYDPEALRLALCDVARARNTVGSLAEPCSVVFDRIDRLFSENGNPELRSLEALLDAL
ncbi:MAG: transcriptional regulator, partial [Myxococcota bacterium]